MSPGSPYRVTAGYMFSPDQLLKAQSLIRMNYRTPKHCASSFCSERVQIGTYTGEELTRQNVGEVQTWSVHEGVRSFLGDRRAVLRALQLWTRATCRALQLWTMAAYRALQLQSTALRSTASHGAGCSADSASAGKPSELWCAEGSSGLSHTAFLVGL